MKEELCGECGRVATHIVNECAYVCDYHAEGAKLEGWIVELIAMTEQEITPNPFELDPDEEYDFWYWEMVRKERLEEMDKEISKEG